MPDNDEYRREIEKLKGEHKKPSKLRRFKKGLRGAIKGMSRRTLATLIIALLIISFLGYWSVKIFGVIATIAVILIFYFYAGGNDVIRDPKFSDQRGNIYYNKSHPFN
ncbi:MAG: hypothetical protein M1510_11930 [Nitrospirae bacterium]|nr:hypothetical protein [Nitrospirota bacterium]MCL5237069.1 hypothetical protein [Nitrospirota bacterium]